MGKNVTGVYRGTWGKADFIDSASVTPTTTTFTETGRITVTAGQAVMMGYGNRRGQDDAEGRIYINIRSTTPTDLQGVVRFDVHNPQDRPVRTLCEFRTETLRTSATDPTQQVPFPVVNYALPEDWSIVMKFKGDAATALTLADSTVLVSYTNMDVA